MLNAPCHNIFLWNRFNRRKKHEKVTSSENHSFVCIFSPLFVNHLQWTPSNWCIFLCHPSALCLLSLCVRNQLHNIQVFFRAGVLGQMEEFRDERLGKIMSWMQAWIRGYLARKEYKKIQEQRIALQIVQRNLRKYMQLRTWPWWKLWQKVKPLLNVTRVEDEIAVSIIPGLFIAYCCYLCCRHSSSKILKTDVNVCHIATSSCSNYR